MNIKTVQRYNFYERKNREQQKSQNTNCGVRIIRPEPKPNITLCRFGRADYSLFTIRYSLFTRYVFCCSVLFSSFIFLPKKRIGGRSNIFLCVVVIVQMYRAKNGVLPENKR
jgi:hypothetical protein